MMKQYKLSSTARAAMTLAQAARRATAALAIILLTAMTAGAQTPSGNWNDWVNDNNIDWDSADAKAAAIPQSDDGSTVYISTAEQLAYYAYAVNNDKQISGSASGYYCGRTVELMADIDLSAHYWKPIGWNTIGRNRAHYFSGYFHGNGHVITGIHVNGDPKSDIVQQNHPGYGLFGYLHERSSGTSTITDLVLKDFSITASYSDGNADEFYLGGLVGKCDDNTAITNCLLVNGSVSKAFQNYWAYIGKVAGRGSPSTATANYYHNVSVSGWISGGGGGNYALQTIGGETEARAVALTISGTHGNVALGGTVGRISNGIIYAPANETVTLNTTADAGYIASLAATGLTLTSGQFTMPDNDDGTIAATISIDPAQFSQDDAGTEYTIHTAGGWNVFCDLLAENANGYFSGKTVRLGADITVTRMAGGSNHAFTGTFDGQGHTLTVNYGTADEPVNAQFVAPFVEVTGGAKFTNLNIGGHIYAAYTGTDDPGVGGLIGHLFGGITIEDCTSTVTVNSTKDRVGGFVGLCEHAVTFTDCKSSAVVTCTGSGSGFVGWSRASDKNYTIAFEGCLFDGKVLKKNDVGSGNGGFVGWTGSTKTVSIQNSLVALDGVGSMASGNSTTFARGWDGTFDNSFYTQPFGTAQGKQARSITADDYVTVENAGTATTYSTSGITSYGTGILYDNVLYAGNGDVVSLNLSNSIGGDVPEGYQYAYSTNAGTLEGSTLTMPNADVIVSVSTALRSTGQPVTVAYMTAAGTTRTYAAIALDGHEAVDENGYVCLDAGIYYVGTDIAYANRIRPTGNITLILADGKTMTLNGNMWGICGGSYLTIYGQSLDAATAGTLRYNGKSDGINVYKYEQHSGNVSITTSGSLVRGIIADVTLRGGTLTISANSNDACAIYGERHSILGGHLTATATGTNAIGIYASATGGTALTLGWTRPDDRITASSISTYGGTVAVVADGQAFIDEDGNIYTGIIAQVDQAYAIDGKTLYPYIEGSVPYIDENGQRQLCTQYTIFDGQTTLGTGWYVADGTHYYNQTITINGNVHLILKDNAVMNVGLEEDPIHGHGIHVDGYSFSIYAQSTGESQGQLHVIASHFDSSAACGIYAENSSITINGGKVTVNGIYVSDIYIDTGSVTINGGQVYADIFSNNIASVTINGGQVTAGNIDAPSGVTINGGQVTANHGGINAIDGNIKLGWTNPTDFIHANRYLVNDGTLSIAEGKAFINAEGDIYESGTVNASDINGKTLRPYSNSMLFLADDADNTAIISKFNDQTYNVTLAGRTLYKDGSWNTLCLPFSVSTASGTLSGDNVQAMTLNTATSGLTGSTLTLNFTDATGQTIPAGTPFIIKWDNTGVNIENPVFEGVTVSNATNDATVEGVLTFTGTYAPVSIGSEGDNTKLYLGSANKLYYPNAAMTIGTHRAYFQLAEGITAGNPAGGNEHGDDVEDLVRAFNLNFGDDEATGIVSAEANSSFFTLHSSLSEWYTLDGRRLDGQPTAKGIYINNGRKVVIK